MSLKESTSISLPIRKYPVSQHLSQSRFWSFFLSDTICMLPSAFGFYPCSLAVTLTEEVSTTFCIETASYCKHKSFKLNEKIGHLSLTRYAEKHEKISIISSSKQLGCQVIAELLRHFVLWCFHNFRQSGFDVVVVCRVLSYFS